MLVAPEMEDFRAHTALTEKMPAVHRLVLGATLPRRAEAVLHRRWAPVTPRNRSRRAKWRRGASLNADRRDPEGDQVESCRSLKAAIVLINAGAEFRARSVPTAATAEVPDARGREPRK